MTILRFTIFFFALVLVFSGQGAAEDRLAYSCLTKGYWQIWTADVSGNRAKQVTFDQWDKKKPVWLSAKTILFLGNTGALWAINPDKGKPVRKFPGFQVESMAPGPGEGKLLLAVYEPSARDVSHIWIADMQTEKTVKLTRGTDLNRSPAGINGKDLVIYTATGIWKDSTLMMTDPAGSAGKPLLRDRFHNLSPSVSPDGKKVVYSSDLSGNYDIWEMDLSTLEKRQLTDFNGLDTDPKWSPDGKLILFVSTRDGQTGIWKMTVDQGKDIRKAMPKANPKAQRVTKKTIQAKDPWWAPENQ